MKKIIYINCDEEYPFYSFSDNTVSANDSHLKRAEVTEAEYKFLSKAEEDYTKAQEILAKLFESEVAHS